MTDPTRPDEPRVNAAPTRTGNDHVATATIDPLVRDSADPLLHQVAILAHIHLERERAEEKFPGQHLPLGFRPGALWLPGGAFRADEVRNVLRAMCDRAGDYGALTWLHVIAEEAAEAFAEDDPAKARTELLQLAAMAVRAIEDIDNPQPADFTGPSGVHWRQIGTTEDGNPVLAASGADITDADRLVETQPTWGKATDG